MLPEIYRHSSLQQCSRLILLCVFANVFTRSIQRKLRALPFNTHLSVPNLNAMEIVQHPSTTHTRKRTCRRAQTPSHKCTHTQEHTGDTDPNTSSVSSLSRLLPECLFLPNLCFVATRESLSVQALKAQIYTHYIVHYHSQRCIISHIKQQTWKTTMDLVFYKINIIPW